ncbi:MAG: DUF4870 domain-containing protein [Caldilineaceae bacterium]
MNDIQNSNVNPQAQPEPWQPEPLQPPYGYTAPTEPVVSLPGSDRPATPAPLPPVQPPPVQPLPPVSPPLGSLNVNRPVSIDSPAPGTPESNTNYQRFADEAGKQLNEAAEAIRRGEFITESVVDPSADKDDRLVGLLSYIVPVLLPLIVLFSESSARRPFQRYHAVQSLGLSGGLIVLSIVLTVVTGVLQVIPIIGWIIGALLLCLTPILFLMLIVAMVYYGAQAYQGKRFAVPVVTNFLINQGWL